MGRLTPRLEGKGIYLEALSPGDVDEAYLGWLADPEVSRFLESRWSTFDLDSLRSWVERTNDGKTNYLFGIFLAGEEMHIGNIKVGGLDANHRYADLGLLIGEKQFWGRGIGTEAIALATGFAFDQLQLNKLVAAVYEGNEGSLRAFLKNGYERAGVLRRHVRCDGGYRDLIVLEKLNDAADTRTRREHGRGKEKDR